MVGGLHIATLPSFLKLFCVSNLAPAANALWNLQISIFINILSLVSPFQTKILNVTVVYEALHNAICEASVSKILQAWQEEEGYFVVIVA